MQRRVLARATSPDGTESEARRVTRIQSESGYIEVVHIRPCSECEEGKVELPLGMLDAPYDGPVVDCDDCDGSGLQDEEDCACGACLWLCVASGYLPRDEVQPDDLPLLAAYEASGCERSVLPRPALVAGVRPTRMEYDEDRADEVGE